MNKIGIKIAGTGSHVPPKILTNQDLEEIVETSDEWIKSRTGMSERRISSDKETASTLGAEAARNALIDAEMDPLDIDLLLVATGSPDMLFPSTACLVQNLVGANHAAAFDISAACSGYIYALSVAEQYIKTGKYRNILLVASDVITKYVDWTDRNTCVLFGDGASATVLTASDDTKTGLLSTLIFSDGSLSDLLFVKGGGSSCPLSRKSIDEKENLLKMKGNSLFKIAVRRMVEASKDTLRINGLSVSDVDMLIPHQANMRIMNSVAGTLGIPKEKVFVNIEKYGNTVAVTIPLALDEARKQKKINKGDTILLTAFGGGLTWGSALIKL